jgi:hypothetical protein
MENVANRHKNINFNLLLCRFCTRQINFIMTGNLYGTQVGGYYLKARS